MQEVKQEMEFYAPEEEFNNGIWPQSALFWMSSFYMALFIIRPWEKIFPFLGIIHFERVYALFMIIAVLLSGSTKFEMNSQNATVLFFLGILGLTSLFAIDTSLSWSIFYKYLTLVIFYFIVVLVIRSPYELVFFILTYLTIMATYLGKSQWEYFVNGCRQYRMGVWRLCGIEETFGGPNAVAASIVFSLPLLLFFWKNRSKISIDWPNSWKKKLSLFLVFYFVLAVSSIILTNSRSGMVSFILFLGLICLKGRNFLKKLGYILLGIFFLAIIWQIMPGEGKNRFRTIWDKDAGPANAQESTQGRIDGFKAGIEIFKRFPLTGVGMGNFIPYRVSHLDGIALQPHNMVGQMLGETGLLGATAFFLMIFTALLNCRKIVVYGKQAPDDTTEILEDLAVGCRDVIILLLFEGLVGHNLLRFNWLWIAAFSNIALQGIKSQVFSYSH